MPERDVGRAKLLIPVFAGERTQEIVYDLHQLEREGKILEIPIVMARDHRTLINRETYTAASEARPRIIEAGIRCIVRDGIVGATMAAIASESEVSKALLHYHFIDRTRLLAEIVTTLGQRLMAREREALNDGETTSAVDMLWRWTEAELKRGELRALLELGTIRLPVVCQANTEVRTARRTVSASTVENLFARLGLTPRIPVLVLAQASMVFIDGLALAIEADQGARPSFDVFWLAMLSLGD